MMLFCVLGLMFCFAHIIFQVVITQTFMAGMNSAASALSSVWSLTCLSILQNTNRQYYHCDLRSLISVFVSLAGAF